MHPKMCIWLFILVDWIMFSNVETAQAYTLASRVGFERSTEDSRNFASNGAYSSTPAAAHQKFESEAQFARLGFRNFFKIGPSNLFWGLGVEAQKQSQLTRQTSVMKTSLEASRMDVLAEVGSLNPFLGKMLMGYDLYAGMLLTGSAAYKTQYDLDDFENESKKLDIKAGRVVGGSVTMAFPMERELRLGIFIGYRIAALELQGADEIYPTLYAYSGPNGGLFVSF